MQLKKTRKTCLEQCREGKSLWLEESEKVRVENPKLRGEGCPVHEDKRGGAHFKNTIFALFSD